MPANWTAVGPRVCGPCSRSHFTVPPVAPPDPDGQSIDLRQGRGWPQGLDSLPGVLPRLLCNKWLWTGHCCWFEHTLLTLIRLWLLWHPMHAVVQSGSGKINTPSEHCLVEHEQPTLATLSKQIPESQQKLWFRLVVPLAQWDPSHRSRTLVQFAVSSSGELFQEAEPDLRSMPMVRLSPMGKTKPR